MTTAHKFTLNRRLAVEFIGTAFLVAAVVGSGIMGDNLAGGNDAVALLANTLATGAALIFLILIFEKISGAHFNPVVSLSFALQKQLSWSNFCSYSAAQITGGICGTMAAHFMFNLPLIMTSTHARTGAGIWMAEIIATLALLASILGCARARPEAVPYAVGMVIMAGYWYTSSTSFANPAVTIARTLSDTFAGIRPVDAPAFIVMQVIGAILMTLFFSWLYKRTNKD